MRILVVYIYIVYRGKRIYTQSKIKISKTNVHLLVPSISRRKRDSPFTPPKWASCALKILYGFIKDKKCYPYLLVCMWMGTGSYNEKHGLPPISVGTSYFLIDHLD